MRITRKSLLWYRPSILSKLSQTEIRIIPPKCFLDFLWHLNGVDASVFQNEDQAFIKRPMMQLAQADPVRNDIQIIVRPRENVSGVYPRHRVHGR